MSGFLYVNLQDFGLNDDITETVKSATLFCICCLDRNAKFLKLTGCKHTVCLDEWLKHEVILVCHDIFPIIPVANPKK